MMSQHIFSKNLKHTCPCSSIKNLRGVEIFHDNHTLYCFVLQILKKAPEEAILLDNISTALSIKFPFFREMPVYELNSIIKQEIRFLSEYFEDFIHINNDGFCYFESKTKDEIVEISDEEDNVENILPHRSILGTGATLQPASISDQEPRTQNQNWDNSNVENSVDVVEISDENDSDGIENIEDYTEIPVNDNISMEDPEDLCVLGDNTDQETVEPIKDNSNDDPQQEPVEPKKLNYYEIKEETPRLEEVIKEIMLTDLEKTWTNQKLVVQIKDKYECFKSKKHLEALVYMSMKNCHWFKVLQKTSPREWKLVQNKISNPINKNSYSRQYKPLHEVLKERMRVLEGNSWTILELTKDLSENHPLYKGRTNVASYVINALRSKQNTVFERIENTSPMRWCLKAEYANPVPNYEDKYLSKILENSMKCMKDKVWWSVEELGSELKKSEGLQMTSEIILHCLETYDNDLFTKLDMTYQTLWSLKPKSESIDNNSLSNNFPTVDDKTDISEIIENFMRRDVKKSWLVSDISKELKASQPSYKDVNLSKLCKKVHKIMKKYEGKVYKKVESSIPTLWVLCSPSKPLIRKVAPTFKTPKTVCSPSRTLIRKVAPTFKSPKTVCSPSKTLIRKVAPTFKSPKTDKSTKPQKTVIFILAEILKGREMTRKQLSQEVQRKYPYFKGKPNLEATISANLSRENWFSKIPSVDNKYRKCNKWSITLKNFERLCK